MRRNKPETCEGCSFIKHHEIMGDYCSRWGGPALFRNASCEYYRSKEESQRMGAQRKTTETGFAEFLKEPDDLIRALNRILDALLFTREMQSRNNCNNCGAKYECPYVPEPGESVTWNCPLWEDPEDTPEEKNTPKEIQKDKGFFVGVGHELKPEINDGDLVALINKVLFNKEEDGKC